MSDDQDHPRRGGDADTERALDELRVALEQLAARVGAGFREDLAEIRAIAASVAERDLTADMEALRVDVATLVGRDSARLDDDSGRAQVLARFERLESRLDAMAGSDGPAEVVARIDALASRFDAMPSSQQIANLPGDLRAHLADALAGFDGEVVTRELAAIRSRLGAGDGPLLEQLQDNLADVASGEVVGALWDEVRQLRTDLPDLIVVPEPAAPQAHEPGPQLAALTDELSVLRTELADGLVVEPSEALSTSLDDLKAELDGLRAALADGVHVGDGDLPVGAPAPDGTGIEALADQVAALRDFVASELDTVSQTVSARLDAAAETTAAAVAAATARPEPTAGPPAEVTASIDPSTVESLRDEIRASGAIGDQVVDALREELKALRRRIAVKASERVLDEQQLAQIADAVVARLAEDRDRT